MRELAGHQPMNMRKPKLSWDELILDKCEVPVLLVFGILLVSMNFVLQTALERPD